MNYSFKDSFPFSNVTVLLHTFMKHIQSLSSLDLLKTEICSKTLTFFN